MATSANLAWQTLAVLGLSAICFGGELSTSDSVPLAGGALQVSWYQNDQQRCQDVLVHFHGHHPTCAKNFHEAALDGALVTVNFRGLSSAYKDPFAESPTLFNEVLRHAWDIVHRDQLRSAGEAWETVCVSSFSAGYGAVRELLKSPTYFQRIDAIVAADSIYASIVKGSNPRRADPLQMKDFRRFAQAACDGEKTFVVSHTQLVTEYASTFETADDLLSAVGLSRHPIEESAEEDAGPSIACLTRAHRGKFWVFGCRGDDGPAHMQHLQHIATWWKYLPMVSRDSSSQHPHGQSGDLR